MKKKPVKLGAGMHTIGRRFSRRKVDVHLLHGHESWHISIDHDEYLSDQNVARFEAESLSELRAGGVPADRILAEAPGGSMLVDFVLNSLDEELDSRLALAARIVEKCIRIRKLPELGADVRMMMNEAYVLGRLVILRRIYAIEDEAQVKRKEGLEIKYSAAQREQWKWLRQNTYPRPRTARSAAGLIAREEGLPQSAIETIRKVIDK